MTTEQEMANSSEGQQNVPGSYIPPSDSPLFKLLVKSFIGAGESGTGIDDVTDQGRFGVEVSSQHAQTQEPLEIEERSTGGIEKVTKSDDIHKHLGNSHDQKKHGRKSDFIDIDTIGISVLKEVGYDAYVVGGTVRDFFIGKQPHDIDIATNATPEEMIPLFEDAGYRVIPTGMRHGTITVIDPENGPVEITTYRTESEYSDGRRPDYVDFSSSIEEDLARRDFTINAIAYDPTDGKIVDPYGGQNDIEQGVIRTVGNPTERFMEDGLRPLRAARFSSTLGFDIDPETLDAMSDPKVIENFGKVSKERVRDEVMKAMSGDNPVSFVETTMATGLNQHIIPELYECLGVEQPQKYHEHDVAGHLIEALDYANREGASPFVKLVALLHDIGKPETQGEKEDGQITFHGHDKVGANKIASIMERLRFSKNEVDKAYTLVLNHLVQLPVDSSESAIRRFVNKVGEENIPDLIMLRRADIAGHGDKDTSKVDAELENFVDKYEQMKQSGSATTPSLAIGGKELMEVGMKPGPEMGKVISYLKEVVTEDPSKNNKNDLIDAVNQSGLLKNIVIVNSQNEVPFGYDILKSNSNFSYYDMSKWHGPRLEIDVVYNSILHNSVSLYKNGSPSVIDMSHSVLAENVVGYRIMFLDDKEDFLANVNIGDIISDNNYISLSINKPGVLKHENSMLSLSHGDNISLVFMVELPAGTNAMYLPIQNKSLDYREGELILPPSSAMQIEEIFLMSSNSILLRARVLENSTIYNARPKSATSGMTAAQIRRFNEQSQNLETNDQNAKQDTSGNSQVSECDNPDDPRIHSIKQGEETPDGQPIHVGKQGGLHYHPAGESGQDTDGMTIADPQIDVEDQSDVQSDYSVDVEQLRQMSSQEKLTRLRQIFPSLVRKQSIDDGKKNYFTLPDTQLPDYRVDTEGKTWLVDKANGYPLYVKNPKVDDLVELNEDVPVIQPSGESYNSPRSGAHGGMWGEDISIPIFQATLAKDYPESVRKCAWPDVDTSDFPLDFFMRDGVEESVDENGNLVSKPIFWLVDSKGTNAKNKDPKWGITFKAEFKSKEIIDITNRIANASGFSTPESRYQTDNKGNFIKRPSKKEIAAMQDNEKQVYDYIETDPRYRLRPEYMTFLNGLKGQFMIALDEKHKEAAREAQELFNKNIQQRSQEFPNGAVLKTGIVGIATDFDNGTMYAAMREITNNEPQKEEDIHYYDLVRWTRTGEAPREMNTRKGVEQRYVYPLGQFQVPDWQYRIQRERPLGVIEQKQPKPKKDRSPVQRIK